MHKPIEYWLIFAGLFLFMVPRKAHDAPWWQHITKITSSALLGVGGSPWLAEKIGTSEATAVGLIMAFIQIVLELALGLISDRDWVVDNAKEAIPKKMRLRPNPKQDQHGEDE